MKFAEAVIEPFDNSLLDRLAYMQSLQQCMVVDGYVRLHIRPKPVWMPVKIYNGILKRILYLAKFRRYHEDQDNDAPWNVVADRHINKTATL